jgi:hypothetical protein
MSSVRNFPAHPSTSKLVALKLSRTRLAEYDRIMPHNNDIKKKNFPAAFIDISKLKGSPS